MALSLSRSTYLSTYFSSIYLSAGEGAAPATNSTQRGAHRWPSPSERRLPRNLHLAKAKCCNRTCRVAAFEHRPVLFGQVYSPATHTRSAPSFSCVCVCILCLSSVRELAFNFSEVPSKLSLIKEREREKDKRMGCIHTDIHTIYTNYATSKRDKQKSPAERTASEISKGLTRNSRAASTSYRRGRLSRKHIAGGTDCSPSMDSTYLAPEKGLCSVICCSSWTPCY